jgi:ferrochelatase
MTEASTEAPKRRVAVILFNLGGPDGPNDVRPFLRNLFRDPAIIAAPGLAREALAILISTTRAKSARANYALMGGGSPLLAETRKQAAALETSLKATRTDVEWKVIVGMRYWKPTVAQAAAEASAWGATEAVLLPLYPQFSTTTTASSLTAWFKAAPEIPARTICCYPDAKYFVRAHAGRIEAAWRRAGAPANIRVLFSAHGLPKRVVDDGDPYQWQVERTVAAVAALLPPELADHVVCYQSRVGPLEWIGPSTEEEIRRAGSQGKSVLVSPIAFVSEHVETLVELDHEYGKVAEETGVPVYLRAAALGLDALYIAALAELATNALAGPPGLKPPGGARICPSSCGKCPNVAQQPITIAPAEAQVA